MLSVALVHRALHHPQEAAAMVVFIVCRHCGGRMQPDCLLLSGSLAPRSTPGSTKSRIVIAIAGFFTFENWTCPLTGSPPSNSASGAGSSAGCRNQEELREKRGCECRSHVVFRQGRADNEVILLYIALRPSAQSPICNLQSGSSWSELPACSDKPTATATALRPPKRRECVTRRLFEFVPLGFGFFHFRYKRTRVRQ